MSMCIFSRCLQFKQFSKRYRKGFRCWGFHKIKWQGESLIETLQHWDSLRSKSKKFVYLLFKSIFFASRVSASPTSVGDETRQKCISSEHRLCWEAISFQEISKTDDSIDKANVLTKSLQTLWMSMILRFLWHEIKIHWRRAKFCWWKELASRQKTSSWVKSFYFDIHIVITLTNIFSIRAERRSTSTCDIKWQDCIWRFSNVWHKILLTS